MQNKTDIETAYRIKINLRPAVLCKHRCEECRFCTFSGDEDGGEYVWCRHPHTLSLPDFFNIMEENMVCDLFEPCPGVQTIGFKAGQSKDGGLGDEREVSPTLSRKPSALEPTAAQSQCDLSQMRYIVRRLTPTEAERLMGLPDGYTIPRGLEITDELVAEFRRIHDTYGAIMYDYAHAKWEREGRKGREPKPPKPKSAAWVRKWLEKISNPDTCPDSPRYRATGNGWATNQPRWILARLLALGEGIDPFTGEEL